MDNNHSMANNVIMSALAGVVFGATMVYSYMATDLSIAKTPPSNSPVDNVEVVTKPPPGTVDAGAQHSTTSETGTDRSSWVFWKFK